MTSQQEKLQNKTGSTISSETPDTRGLSREKRALLKIGKEVEAARKQKGLSIRAVSQETGGISEATISNFEKGKLKNITLNNLIAICMVVNINSISF